MSVNELKFAEYLKYELGHLFCKKCDTNIFAITVNNKEIWIRCSICGFVFNIGEANESLNCIIEN